LVPNARGVPGSASRLVANTTAATTPSTATTAATPPVRVDALRSPPLGSRVIERLKIFPKTVDQVGLGDQDKDRKTNVKLPLDHLELTSDLGGFPCHLLRGILDQTFHGNRQQQPVHRAVVSMFFQEAEKLSPFARHARFNLSKSVSRRVENHAYQEPPIHADRAADSLNSSCNLGGKPACE
jgi:hypothetical protein